MKWRTRPESHRVSIGQIILALFTFYALGMVIHAAVNGFAGWALLWAVMAGINVSVLVVCDRLGVT